MTLEEATIHAREKAKELREQAGFDTDNERYRMSESEKSGCIECAKEHEQLAEWLEELAERREADRWIPVSERLPDKNMKCLVSLDCGKAIFDIYHTRWGFVNYIGSVVAWKPLPEPYQKGVAENEAK